MFRHHETGKEGELLARKFLEKEGYEIITTNWRYGRLELDIIAEKQGVLHIVEVKTLSSTSAGFPEEQVTHKKMDHLTRAADAFLHQYGKSVQLQFDIVSVVLKEGDATYLHIQDIYY
jgi:putative endonuclease